MNDPTAERRIVVGVDGSQPSRRALQWARFMARVLDAAIDAVAVWDISPVMAEGWVDDWNPEKDTAANLITPHCLDEPRPGQGGVRDAQ